MIENIVRKYLKASSGLPAYLEEPAEPPAEYIVVEKTGSGDGEHIGRATVAVQCYAGSLLNAAERCRAVKALMERLPEQVMNVTRCRCLGDYNFTDSNTHRYRYQAVFDIVYYEE